MKLKDMVLEITALCEDLGCKVLPEFRTSTGTRIDAAIIKNNKPALAVEFENSYKWIAQRVLYNSLKAHKAGFDKVLFVYPFKKEFTNKLVKQHLKEIGLSILFADKQDYLSKISKIVKNI